MKVTSKTTPPKGAEVTAQTTTRKVEPKPQIKPELPEQKRVRVTRDRADFLAIYNDLPSGERAYIEPLLTRVFGAIAENDRERVRDLILTYPCPSETLIAARDRAVKFFA